MPTLDFITGFNHRVVSQAGLGLADAVNAGSISTTTVRHAGGSSLQLTVLGVDSWSKQATASATNVDVFYVNFSVLPDHDTTLTFCATSALASAYVGIAFVSATAQLALVTRVASGTPTVSAAAGPTISTGVWYRVDVSVDKSANPWTITAQVSTGDGTATSLGSTTAALASSTATMWNFTFATGGYGTGATTGTMFVTDVAFSNTAADYPIGAIQVNGYSPTAIGTHSLDAATSAFYFKEVSAVDTALTTAETTSYQTIDDVPLDADIDAIFVAPTVAFNAISRIGSNAVVSATNVPPAHAVGDLILVFAYRSGSATAPSVATGYTDLGTSTVAGGSARSVRMAYKIATATTGEGAAFTNSTDTVTVIYRNAQSPVAGDITFTQGTTQAQTYGALTISDTSHSWAAGFIGVSLTATGNSNTAPAGMTNITSAGTGPSAGGHDTNAIRGSNWSSTNVTGSAAGNWITAVIEIKATSTATQPSAALYAEYNFADESTLTSAPLAVRALAAQNLDTATASTWVAKLFDSVQGTNTEDVSNTSVSSVTKAYVGKTFAQRPNTGGVWTVAALNGIRLRFGLTAAATGHPRIEASMLEAAFAVTAAATKAPPFQARTARNFLLRR